MAIDDQKNKSNKTEETTKMKYSNMKKDELRAICKEKCIKRYSGKNKEELIEMIKQRDATPVSAPKVEAEINVTVKAQVKVEVKTPKSKNSLNAINGNLAEAILCKSHVALDKLGSQYFKKKIVACEKIAKKKSDHRITFEDGTCTTIQLKNGTGGGRGWSFDRRPLTNLPTNECVKELIKSVCLKSGGERKILPIDKTLLSRLLLGDEELTKPQHFLHTTLKHGMITSLSVCPASLFIDTIVKTAYENYNAKRTCVHLTPLIYLQRKGGGKKDHSPDDIQAKLRCMPDCLTEITID